MNEFSGFPGMNGVPLGLGMALMHNSFAMGYFSELTEEERKDVIERTHSVNSKDEMRTFVDSLGKEKYS